MSGLNRFAPALYTKLTTASGKPAGWDVVEYVTEGQEKPYLAIGEKTETPRGAFKTLGWDDTITMHGYSEYKGDKECRVMLEWLTGVLHGKTLTVPSGSLGALRVEFSDISKDPESGYHLVVRLRGRVRG